MKSCVIHIDMEKGLLQNGEVLQQPHVMLNPSGFLHSESIRADGERFDQREIDLSVKIHFVSS